MSRYLPENLKTRIRNRAKSRCEYCRRPEGDSFIRYQIDHIISLRHGGNTDFENLALACPICNLLKGTDLATVLGDDEKIVPLFHPRKHDWFDHFEVADGLILAKSEIGEATVKHLEFNEINRILERIDLIEAGVFP